MSKKKEMDLRFHPAAKRRGLALGTAIFLGVMLGAMFVVVKEIYIIIVLVGLMVYSVLPFYVPTDYHLDGEGISMMRYGKKRVHKWSDYRSYSVQSNGIVIWTDVAGANTRARFGTQMKALGSSVFFPMDKEMIEEAEPLLRTVLVKS